MKLLREIWEWETGTGVGGRSPFWLVNSYCNVAFMLSQPSHNLPIGLGSRVSE